MISNLKDFNNKINNLKNINNKENTPNKIDILITFFEIFFIIPFILFILPIPKIVSASIYGGALPFALLFFYPLMISFNLSSLTHYFISKYNKLRFKNLNINENLERRIFNYKLFIDNKVVNKTIDYYNSLNDVEKDFYFSNLHYEEYIYNSLANHIKKSELREIRKNKEIIAEIISKHLRKSYLKDIKKIIQDRLELDEDNNKKEIINMFDNKKEIEIEKKTKTINSILKEI